MSLDSRAIPLCRSAFLLFAVLLFAARFQSVAHAMEPLCSEVCDATELCSEQCLDDSDSQSYCGQYNGGQSNGMCYGDCGDGYCMPDHGESCSTCHADCGFCGVGCTQDADCPSGDFCSGGSCWAPCPPEGCYDNGGTCTDPQDCNQSYTCCDSEICMDVNGHYSCVAPG